MEIKSESGILINQPVEIDLENPDQSYIFPKLKRLNTWLSRKSFDSLEATLKFLPGIYILSELTHDDTDLGIYKARYIDNLVQLEDERKVDWASSSGLLDRRVLRPLPEAMNDYLSGQHSTTDFDFQLLVNSYLMFVTDHQNLKTLSNDSFHIHSRFGQSEDEFREVCFNHAFLEKSERALKLAEVMDRELQQNRTSIFNELSAKQIQSEEETFALAENYELMCKSLLNKAISWHNLGNYQKSGPGKAPQRYEAVLLEEMKRLSQECDQFKSEFIKFGERLIEKFTEIEYEANYRASNITTVQVPPSNCSLRLLRVCKVWLPFWNINYSSEGREKTRMIRAY